MRHQPMFQSLFQPAAMARFEERNPAGFDKFQPAHLCELLEIHADVLGSTVTSIFKGARRTTRNMSFWRQGKRHPSVEMVRDLDAALTKIYQTKGLVS